MRVTPGTNILLSATFWIGSPHRIVRLAEEGRIRLVLSPAILAEYRRILRQERFRVRIRGAGATVDDLVSKLADLSVLVEPRVRLNVVRQDPPDNRILECALEGKAEAIVSGDRHLLELREFRRVPILRAAEFLARGGL